MKINQKIKCPLTWAWSIDIYFYAVSFPVIQCIVNRQLTIPLYAIPSLIVCLFGGLLNLGITEKKTLEYLYDNWFLQITLFDALVWIAYFALWIFEVVPDKWYPIASSIMHVSTVQLSRAIRSELENRLYPISEEKTEFDNACGILCDLFNALGSITILLLSIKSFLLAKTILLFALIVDNMLFLLIWQHFKKGKLNDTIQNS